MSLFTVRHVFVEFVEGMESGIRNPESGMRNLQGKRIKRKIHILLRFVRQVVRGVACHAMFTTYDYPIGLKAIYLTFVK